MKRGYSSSEKPADQLIPPGQKAADPKQVAADREIVVTFKLKTHGSLTNANSFITYVGRQLSVMLHNDVELIDYDVKLADDEVEEDGEQVR